MKVNLKKGHFVVNKDCRKNINIDGSNDQD